MRKNPKEAQEIKNIIKELKHLSDNLVIRMDTDNERTSEISYRPTNILP